MENNNNNNGRSLLNRFLPASNQGQGALNSWTQIIDLIIGFFLIIPNLGGMRGFFPVLLAVIGIVVSMMALYLLATNNSNFTRTWYRTRNVFYGGVGILYILPIIALFMAHSTLNSLGASFSPLLLSVHIPVLIVVANLFLSHVIGRRLNSTENRSRE